MYQSHFIFKSLYPGYSRVAVIGTAGTGTRVDMEIPDSCDVLVISSFVGSGGGTPYRGDISFSFDGQNVDASYPMAISLAYDKNSFYSNPIYVKGKKIITLTKQLHPSNVSTVVCVTFYFRKNANIPT